MLLLLCQWRTLSLNYVIRLPSMANYCRDAFKHSHVLAVLFVNSSSKCKIIQPLLYTETQFDDNTLNVQLGFKSYISFVMMFWNYNLWHGSIALVWHLFGIIIQKLYSRRTWLDLSYAFWSNKHVPWFWVYLGNIHPQQTGAYWCCKKPTGWPFWNRIISTVV